MNADKRCICGRSSTFPLCDGQHVSDGWQCAPRQLLDTCIVAGMHLRSVAERLAHVTRHAAAAHQLDRLPEQVRQLWVLTDGSDLEGVWAQVRQIRAQSRRAFIIDAPEAVALAFPDWSIAHVQPPTPLALWNALRSAIREEDHAPTATPKRIFISHAVADEARLEGPVSTVRQFGVEVFLCADSIPAGTRWHREILAALESTERLVFVASQASRRSTFCAFELGFAQARDLPTRVIALDDAPLPPFIQHLQAIGVPRRQRRRPWLTAEEALLEAFWESLG